MKRLIFVTTPLQALIASEIQKIDPAEDTLLYMAGSSSPKNRLYFDRFQADEKVFGLFRPDGRSNILTSIARYRALPRSIKRKSFDRVLISSFNSLIFALLQGRARWPVDTFDDGTFNIDPDVILPVLKGEPKTARLIRSLARAQAGADVFLSSERHFSIFDRSEALVGQDKIVELKVFRHHDGAGKCGPVSILLGTPVQATCSAMKRMDLLKRRMQVYSSVVDQLDYDIFLPHPAESLAPRVDPRFEYLREKIDGLIAEELVLDLSRAGYDPTIYGFSSTCLLTLHHSARTVNLLLPEEPHTEYIRRLGIPSYSLSTPADVVAFRAAA